MPEPSVITRAEPVATEIAVVPAPVATATEPKTNEQITWEYLTSNGFTAIQAAGIMGNLMQEHRFNTSDVPGGLGIAQWINGRRAALMQRDNYLSIDTQLQYLTHELNTTERAAGAAIRSAATIVDATVAFQNLFERCGVCMQAQRIQYATDIYARFGA